MPPYRSNAVRSRKRSPTPSCSSLQTKRPSLPAKSSGSTAAKPPRDHSRTAQAVFRALSRRWAPTRSLSSKRSGSIKVDVLGFSIGGLVAQEITLQAPDLVRRLVLVGTGRRSGESTDTGTPEGKQIFGATYEHPDDLWLRVHFPPSDVSQAAGRRFLRRPHAAPRNRH